LECCFEERLCGLFSSSRFRRCTQIDPLQCISTSHTLSRIQYRAKVPVSVRQTPQLGCVLVLIYARSGQSGAELHEQVVRISERVTLPLYRSLRLANATDTRFVCSSCRVRSAGLVPHEPGIGAHLDALALDSVSGQVPGRSPARQIWFPNRAIARWISRFRPLVSPNAFSVIGGGRTGTFRF
jgi:hypothetical protein